ncbi:MAG: anaerobic glycerol-3-phosphate dehydrogenase subunit C [Actinobacteria bacterium]|nr:anaerobic glycerol-3-phosphate dehydrogenase subunit C [Actinomycetota bacterium]
MIEDLIRGSLDHCVKCTICETHCPVSRATPLFPGPKYVGPQAERFRSGDVSPDDSLDYCSGCGICTQVCPQGVKVAEINSRARRTLKESRGIPLRDKIISRPTLSARLATPVAPVANWSLRNKLIRAAVEKTIGVHRRAPMPKFAGRTFQSWARKHDAPRLDRSVVYFHGCSTNFFEPDLGAKTVAVLEHNGFNVIAPRGQGCCGLPLQSNGLFDDATGYVERLVAKLAPYAREGYDIVATSTSCGLMLKREAYEILGMESDDLRVVSERMYDICEFLLDLQERGELETDLSPVPMKVPYHVPCQQRGHEMGKPAVDLFRLIPELQVVDTQRACCGIAGTYGLKKEKYDIAMEVGRHLFEDVTRMEPEVSVCDSETCRWQIEHGTRIRSVHPIELLHRSYEL